MNLEDRNMKKRVFIIHGWQGSPDKGWLLWLKDELEKYGYKVYVPAMPDADKPRIEKWIPYLAQVVGSPDDNTYFVGHSLGCQAIARYLEILSESIKIGGAVFVAGFFKRVTGFELDPELKQIDQHWLKMPIDLKKVRQHLLKSIAIFSDNDLWVPLDNQDDFKNKLGSEIIIEHKMGHFSGDEGITKLPIVLESVLKISKVGGD